MTNQQKTKWIASGGQASSPARVFNGGELIAIVHGNWVTSEPAKRAQLIAAAPELLEVLCTIYGLANLQVLLETKYSKALVNDIMRQMQETIDKAKGEP